MSFLAEGWARVIMVAEICLHDVSVISVIFFLFNLIFSSPSAETHAQLFGNRLSVSPPPLRILPALRRLLMILVILLHIPTNPTLSPMHYAC